MGKVLVRGMLVAMFAFLGIFGNGLSVQLDGTVTAISEAAVFAGHAPRKPRCFPHDMICEIYTP